jgi:hypothetical protein
MPPFSPSRKAETLIYLSLFNKYQKYIYIYIYKRIMDEWGKSPLKALAKT